MKLNYEKFRAGKEDFCTIVKTTKCSEMWNEIRQILGRQGPLWFFAMMALYYGRGSLPHEYQQQEKAIGLMCLSFP